MDVKESGKIAQGFCEKKDALENVFAVDFYKVVP